MNKKLSICITTYNRAKILGTTLAHNLAIAKKYNIPIYVNNNNSSDDTAYVLKKLKKEYKYLFPLTQSANIGFDRNYEHCLKRSKTEYCWGMADYSYISEDSIKEILKITNRKDYDFIFMNNGKRIKENVKSEMTVLDDIIMNIGWAITLLDTIVWSEKYIKKANFNRYYDSIFGYYGAMLESLAENRFKVYWFNKSLVNSYHPEKKSLWLSDSLNTWLVKWPNLILSLPYSISIEKKFFLINEHNTKAKVFSFKNLLFLKIHGYLNRSNIIANNNVYRHFMSPLNFILLNFLSRIPNFLLLKK